ncbi:MAG: DNA-binding protein WhiA [Candidatus Faecousia sp.]|nr:DNA-binding protein WhiA [Candidatus Faecousia sp.]
MQSFSAAAKAEICRELPQSSCCALAECFGILLFCNSFQDDCIKIITESQDFGRLLPKLFRKAFGVGFDQLPEDGTQGKLTYCIADPEKIGRVMEAFGFTQGDTLSLHINLAVVEEECCKASFLRGAFLAGGSVTHPAKAYHLEFTTTHQSVARECYMLLHETMGFYPKTAARSGAQVLYLKQSDLISDFLTFLGAPVAAMGIMEAKLEKELNNQVNRCCNCDDANTSKVVEAAQEQLGAIRVLKERALLEQLPAKLRQAVDAREANPEASLSELAAMMEPPITKPAMNHRLQRIVQLAKEAAQ